MTHYPLVIGVLIYCSTTLGCNRSTPESGSDHKSLERIRHKIIFDGQDILDASSLVPIKSIEAREEDYDILVRPTCAPVAFLKSLDNLAATHHKTFKIEVCFSEGSSQFGITIPMQSEITVGELAESNVEIPRGDVVFARIGPSDTIRLVGAIGAGSLDRPPQVAVLEVPNGIPWIKIVSGIHYLQLIGVQKISFRNLPN